MKSNPRTAECDIPKQQTFEAMGDSPIKEYLDKIPSTIQSEAKLAFCRKYASKIHLYWLMPLV